MKNLNLDPAFYRRRLPHWQPENGTFFVTARLAGSLPKKVIIELKESYELKKKQLKEKGLKGKQLKEALNKCADLYFGKFDHLLDNANSGPTWLKEKAIANIVKNSFHYFDKDRYELICFTIMSNHVHLILHELDRRLFRVMQSIKRSSSRDSNKLLDRVGESFWHSESYDRLIRDEQELFWKINYTLNNPVKAGLVEHWTEWPYNYINPRFLKYVLGN